jgi:SAM-dependent methyltransferase
MALEIQEKSWNEFWARHWRIDQRHKILGIFDYDRQLVAFVEHVCQLAPGNRVLDLGCGGGDQAQVFARRGYEVVGIDIAPPLISFARQQFEEEGLSGTFIAGDMRAINYDAEFDACVTLSGTFGFFGDAEDQKLLVLICKALKPGGKVFINFVAPNQYRGHERTWSEIENGWRLREEWFDSETSTYRSRTFLILEDGTLVKPKPEPGYHADEAIRCYSIPEMQALLAVAGLRYIASYSSRELALPPRELTPDAVRNVVVAERPREKSVEMNALRKSSMSKFHVRPLDRNNEHWVSQFIVEQWGAEIVVARGTTYRPATLPGFVALQKDEKVSHRGR